MLGDYQIVLMHLLTNVRSTEDFKQASFTFTDKKYLFIDFK